MDLTEQDSYKWTALSNTTLGVFMAALNGSIIIISLPAIFRGINLDPLLPSNSGFLLWTLMGYMVCTAVLVVSFGRLGDLLGRVRMYNLGFVVFTIASVALGLTPGQGASAAVYLISMRIFQGVGGALLMANSTAILTDAFPPEQRGLAMGVNAVAALAGSFIGLIAGGILADLHWRLVFLVNAPVGVFGTVWAYLKLHDLNERREVKIDWWGNIAFAVGLVLVLVGITYGIQPYGNHLMGWTSPSVLFELIAGLILLGVFIVIETKVEEPMFDLSLFKIRAFSASLIANFLSAIGRGGLQFMLIIWLQGVWLPLHGYSFESTPLWAGIYMLPLTVGFLLVGPLSGYLSDRYGARYFSTGGMLLGALSFALLLTLPANFPYWAFAFFLLLNGLGSGFFASPNTTATMNSVPAGKRGQASGMRATAMNVGQVLSIGVFFSLMIVGLASKLPATMSSQLTAQGVPASVANQTASAPPIGSLFAAFLGYNPMTKLLPADTLASLPHASSAYITGTSFFPRLISGPFVHGLRIAFVFSIILFLLSAMASWLRGGKYIHRDEETIRAETETLEETIL
ncbi:MAG: MFS transporter [Dehalococcoidia bacterium]|jgi:EmrB/QacA subfamily drug resistance transporter